MLDDQRIAEPLRVRSDVFVDPLFRCGREWREEKDRSFVAYKSVWKNLIYDVACRTEPVVVAVVA